MKKIVLLLSLLLLAACGKVEESNKIISLMPSNTEILYELGVGNDIIGVSTVDDYPKEVNDKKKFDSFNLNKEALIKANPTIIIAHESQKEATEKVLKDIKIPVVWVKDVKRVSDIDDSVMQIAKAINKDTEGLILSNRINDEIKEVKDKYKDTDIKSVFIEISSEPDIYTAGSDTFFNDMVTSVNGDNVFADLNNWPKVSKESIIKRNPDIIVGATGTTDKQFEQMIQKRSGFNEIEAVKQNRVKAINADVLSRPGPRIAEGMEELAKAIHQ